MTVSTCETRGRRGSFSPEHSEPFQFDIHVSIFQPLPQGLERRVFEKLIVFLNNVVL